MKAALLLLVSCALACAQDSPATKPKEWPLTPVQKLALQSIVTRELQLRQDKADFEREVCGSTPCQIDPQRGVAVESPKPPAPEPKK